MKNPDYTVTQTSRIDRLESPERFDGIDRDTGSPRHGVPERIAGPDRSGDAEARSELEVERQFLELAKMDPKFFDFFYKKYNRSIFSFVYRKTLDQEVAEDLTANTFTAALEKIWQFRWRGVRFSSWLYQIARNEIKKHFLKEAQLAWQTAGDHEVDPPDPRLSCLALTILSEDHRRLYECLLRLDEINQDVFILHYWEGLTTGEIAAVLDSSEGTIKSKLKREREKLRAMLLEQAEEDIQLVAAPSRLFKETIPEQGWRSTKTTGQPTRRSTAGCPQAPRRSRVPRGTPEPSSLI